MIAAAASETHNPSRRRYVIFSSNDTATANSNRNRAAQPTESCTNATFAPFKTLDVGRSNVHHPFLANGTNKVLIVLV